MMRLVKPTGIAAQNSFVLLAALTVVTGFAAAGSQSPVTVLIWAGRSKQGAGNHGHQ